MRGCPRGRDGVPVPAGCRCRAGRRRSAARGRQGTSAPGSSRPRARCYATAAAAPSAAMASLGTASPELRAYFSRHNLLHVYEVTAAEAAEGEGAAGNGPLPTPRDPRPPQPPAPARAPPFRAGAAAGGREGWWWGGARHGRRCGEHVAPRCVGGSLLGRPWPSTTRPVVLGGRQPGPHWSRGTTVSPGSIRGREAAPCPSAVPRCRLPQRWPGYFTPLTLLSAGVGRGFALLIACFKRFVKNVNIGTRWNKVILLLNPCLNSTDD